MKQAVQPIRILHMIGSLNVGGSQALVINLYEHVDRTKIQFDFIIDESEQVYYANYIEELGGKIYSLPKFNGKNIFEIKLAWKRFFDEHSEYKILHSHVRSYASIYIPIAKKNGLKTIIHSHSTSNGGGVSSVVKKIMQYPLRYQADFLVGCSIRAGEWLFGKKATTGKNFFLIKNAVDVEAYLPNDLTRVKYRNMLGIDSNAVVYAHIGRFHIAKNHMFLLEVFEKLLEMQPNSKLLLLGDGELRDEIEKKIKDLKIEESVCLLGMRNDIPDVLQAADCFLFPSLWEGLPTSVIEAQAAGLKCFVSDKVTNEVAITNQCVFLDLDTPVNWANKIIATDLCKQDCSEDIKRNGYDIKTGAAWLTDFYIEQFERMHEN